ncbi:MAG: type II secretion system protein GspM [Pseudomonadota bacterium]|nr:type II secretion system protein GspM [Pseudomonadota bacterium]
MTASLARLPPGQQRTLAVALLVLLLGLLLALVLVPVVLIHQHYDSAIDDLKDRLQRYRRVAAQAPEYRKALDAMRERDARRFLLKNTAPNLAGAELQELVRAAVEGNGGRITTSQNQPPKDEGRFRQIGVNLQFFATTQNLQKVLYALESQRPYLLIESLTVRPINAFRGFRPPPGQEPEVNVQMDVAAYSVGEPERSTAAQGRGGAPAAPAGTPPAAAKG